MEAALEAEVTEFLGRERYQRAAGCSDASDGSRNGYRPVTVKTTTGPVTLERPKLRGTTAAFASRLFGKHVTKTNALETLVIAAFVRGLSVRDVEAILTEALGDQAAISKSTVSEICKAIRSEYQAWARRRLDEIALDYLFWDASFFWMHPGSPAEPVLAAWGITTEGKPVFVGLAPGTGESTEAWADFLTDLRERGLGCPLLVVSDGARDTDRGHRTNLPKSGAPEMSYPSTPQRARQDSHRDASRDPRRILGDSRHHRPQYRTGTPAGRDRGQADRGVRRQILRPRPGGYADPAHRQSRDGLSVVSGRTPWARSAFEFY